MKHRGNSLVMSKLTPIGNENLPFQHRNPKTRRRPTACHPIVYSVQIPEAQESSSLATTSHLVRSTCQIDFKVSSSNHVLLAASPWMLQRHFFFQDIETPYFLNVFHTRSVLISSGAVNLDAVVSVVGRWWHWSFTHDDQVFWRVNCNMWDHMHGETTREENPSVVSSSSWWWSSSDGRRRHDFSNFGMILRGLCHVESSSVMMRGLSPVVFATRLLLLSRFFQSATLLPKTPQNQGSPTEHLLSLDSGSAGPKRSVFIIVRAVAVPSTFVILNSSIRRHTVPFYFTLQHSIW